MYNTWYKCVIQKLCCTEDTYYPERSFGCTDLRGDIDALLLKNASSDAMYYACDDVKNIPSSTSITYPDVSLLFGHVPISCTIKGITVVSWNLSGMCNHEKRQLPGQVTMNTSGFTVTPERLREVNERKPFVIQFLDEQFKKQVDVICLQELFLPDKTTHTGIALLQELCGTYKSKYTPFYDGFDGGMIVKNTLLPKKGGTRKKSRRGGHPGLLMFPPNQERKQSILKLNVKGSPLYMVNVCLSNSEKAHTIEMRYVMDHLLLIRAFQKGVLFVGDHKYKWIDFYKGIRPESSRRE